MHRSVHGQLLYWAGRLLNEATYRAVHRECKVQQEQAEVFRSKAIGEHEDEATDDDDWNGIHPEPIAILQLIRKPAMSEGPEDHENIWRSNEQERNGITVSQRTGQGWKEVLETSGSGYAMIHERDDVCLEKPLSSLSPSTPHGDTYLGIGESELHASQMALAT